MRAAARESVTGATKDDKALEKKRKEKGKGQPKKPRGRPRGSGRGRGRARGRRGRGGGVTENDDDEGSENVEMKILAKEDEEIQKELDLDDGDVGGSIINYDERCLLITFLPQKTSKVSEPERLPPEALVFFRYIYQELS